MPEKKFSKYFDHTLLAPDSTASDVSKLCKEAAEYDFYSVCVNSCYVKQAKEELSSLSAENVEVAAVIGFPLGAMHTDAKVFETTCACSNGASEIDMVINIGALIDGRLDYVQNEIEAIAKAAHEQGALLKVILETCLLTRDQIADGCICSIEAGADFVKTSTGFSTGGADAETVRFIKSIVGDCVKIKASGGIRDLQKARDMIDAGADRIGASSTVGIMKEYMAGSNK